MNTKLCVVSIAGAASLLAASFAYGAKAKEERALQERLERGRYLVNGVGLCADCHSPRGPDGQFLSGAHLTGSPLPFAPTVEMPWATVAPPIAGLPGYTREQAVRFLMEGERPSKLPVLPPMPPFRLNQSDAEAVADYLLSLR